MTDTTHTDPAPADQPITEDWLKEVGFKWHQFDRQPGKHWLLWLGHTLKEEDGPSLASYEDIGIELASMRYANHHGDEVGRNAWFCWFRSDAAGRYHRFIHVRHLSRQSEVIALVEAITGQKWSPDNHHFGSAHKPEQAERIRADFDRLDRRLMRDGHPWSPIETDETMGRSLPEHRAAYEASK